MSIFHVSDPPVVAIEIVPSVVIETSNSIVLLRCLALDGNPQLLSAVHWYMNGQLIETSGEEAVHELMLANVTRNQAGSYSCQGLNNAGRASEISMSKELSVQCNSVTHISALLISRSPLPFLSTLLFVLA